MSLDPDRGVASNVQPACSLVKFRVGRIRVAESIEGRSSRGEMKLLGSAGIIVPTSEVVMVDRNLEAYCGLYCGACPVLLERRDDLLYQAVRENFNASDEDLLCQGCRSDVLSVSCRECPKRDCAKSKGLDSCSACPEMPCDLQKNFRLPHASEIVPNLEALRDRGSEAWLAEQAEQWRCASCNRTGSWYERVCPDCGATLPAGHQPPENI